MNLPRAREERVRQLPLLLSVVGFVREGGERLHHLQGLT